MLKGDSHGYQPSQALPRVAYRNTAYTTLGYTVRVQIAAI